MNRMAGKWTSLTFCTTAIFLKAVAMDLNLGRYTHIILDEVSTACNCSTLVSYALGIKFFAY